MAKIDIYPDEMGSLSHRLKKISSVIKDAENIARRVQSNLDFQVSAKEGIASDLRSVTGKLGSHYNKVSELARLTTLSNEEFRIADGQMDKKACNIFNRISTPVAGLIQKLANFFAKVEMERYVQAATIFLSTGSIIGAVGLTEMIYRLKKVTGKTPGGGTAPTTTQQPAPEPVKKPNIVVDTGSSKQNADNAGIKYYTQGKDYNKYWDGNAWIVDDKDYSYKDKVSCGICILAMVASHFDVDLTPGDLLKANEPNGATWDAAGVKNLLHSKVGITKQPVATSDRPTEEKKAKLDEVLAKYQDDPKHNGPPIVSIPSDGPSGFHFLLVVGKDKNGNYITINPGGDNSNTTLKPSSILGVSVFTKDTKG